MLEGKDQRHSNEAGRRPIHFEDRDIKLQKHVYSRVSLDSSVFFHSARGHCFPIAFFWGGKARPSGPQTLAAMSPAKVESIFSSPLY